MTSHINDLLQTHTFLTNAGTETYLFFQQGFDLPEFCAFVVHEDDQASASLEQNYLDPILRTAAESGCGLMLDALLWRAQPDFIAKLGRMPEELGPINHRAVSRTRESVDRWRQTNGHDEHSLPVLIVADIGPRGDGYRVEDAALTAAEARDYHAAQIEALADSQIDLVAALTMTSVAESVGIAQAAADYNLPTIISPTVETDGRLPDGTPLGRLVAQVDQATDASPLLYMVNCAHPTHLLPSLEASHAKQESWLARFQGFRANASTKTHEELDNSTELDRGNIDQLADQMAQMRDMFDLKVIGGCCGTDHEHLAAIAARAIK